MQKTWKGFSLAETLISMALISLLILVYCNLTSLQKSTHNQDQLTSLLFSEAHSLAMILEDKAMNEIPWHLFSSSHSISLAFLNTSNHTNEYCITEFCSLFGLQIPEGLSNIRYFCFCIAKDVQFGSLTSKQILIYVLTNYNKKIIYGYATCVL